MVRACISWCGRITFSSSIMPWILCLWNWHNISLNTNLLVNWNWCVPVCLFLWSVPFHLLLSFYDKISDCLWDSVRIYQFCARHFEHPRSAVNWTSFSGPMTVVFYNHPFSFYPAQDPSAACLLRSLFSYRFGLIFYVNNDCDDGTWKYV